MHSGSGLHKNTSFQPTLIRDWTLRFEEQRGKPLRWNVQGSPQSCSSDFPQSPHSSHTPFDTEGNSWLAINSPFLGGG